MSEKYTILKNDLCVKGRSKGEILSGKVGLKISYNKQHLLCSNLLKFVPFEKKELEDRKKKKKKKITKKSK